ncbi:MAG TPA: NlpC/P60 family protein [Thermotogota bacterium]|mgnify:FL=1|jgi:cell wall-associated NlpC family hydrolase|nr:NlpC/P60 family protein [Thermotogota bacterium]HOS23701.1 NlpC/P60 family protein [Thermotogota bacterium]HPL37958.1 NlpC/P60 family protein [Thermotogota bacterium]HRR44981.1 NlpC/P60 family protein [Mesotoga sp.]
MSKRSPRLQFSDEERASPELKKVIEKADKKADKLDKAEAKIPKKTVKRKERVVGEDGKVSVKLHFEEVDKKKPTSKLSHSLTDAPLNTVLATAHREVRDSEEDNVGVEGAHKLEQVAEGGVRTLDSAHRSHKLKPYREAAYAEKAADKANLKALNKQAQQNNPQFSSNPYSRWQQKRAIKKEYMAAKAGKTGATTAKATQKTAKSAKKAAENTKKTGTFLARHWKGALIVLALLLMIAFLSSVISSCSVLVQSGVTSFAASSYAADDADMLAAEEQYCALEAELQEYLDTYEDTHDYDEYHYDLDDIEHDPYVLISAISALHGGEWTIGEVGGTIQMLFDKQYILTETVTTETRYRTETRTGTTSYIDPETGETVTEEYEYEVQVPYTYYICNVTLDNFNLSHVPVYIMSEEQLSMYATYMATLGNRPDLFPDSQYVGMYIDTEYEDYEIPAEALSDPQFAAMMEEAEKYLGYPYVWGGSSPSTSFDCSGFVSWVINNCGEGWSIGRLGAEGLRNTCSYVSPVNARPGDLIFFEGTYDTSGASHVGIYVGNNMMIHCGDPIQYASINTNYWQQHFLSFGRLPSP